MGITKTGCAVSDCLHVTKASEYVDGNLIYMGEAAPGTAQDAIGWRIYKLAYNGSDVTDLLWADGSCGFDFIWDNRAGYSYS